MYLFVRFHMTKELWPPFEDRLRWYQVKLLAKDDDPFTEMCYRSHLQACEKAFNLAKCRYLKGTHVGRHEGCKLADMIDVPDAQMRRLGRWDHSRMVQHYSIGLPRTGARHLAGHGLKEGITP